MIEQRGGRAWLGCSKKETWKEKEAVSKESEAGDSLLERTENGRKVREQKASEREWVDRALGLDSCGKSMKILSQPSRAA